MEPGGTGDTNRQGFGEKNVLLMVPHVVFVIKITTLRVYARTRVILNLPSELNTKMQHLMFSVKSLLLTRKEEPVRANVLQEDYDHFGIPMKAPLVQSTLSVIADTGCQSCLAGLKVINKLGISMKDLLPVTIKMQAANDHSIGILGAVILRLSGKNTEGDELSARQMVCVTDSTDKLFISREACVDLGVIPRTFPTVGEAEEIRFANAIRTSPPQQECHCPKPPPIPTSLPFPGDVAHRNHLKQYLLDYYASSTFNTCEHQVLPFNG